MTRIAGILVMALTCTSVGAQPTQAITLDTAIAQALERSPRLAIERQTLEAAQAERVVAAARPNPTVSLSRQARSQPLASAGGQQDLTLAWPLQIGAQREARIEVADQGLALAQARVSAQTRQLIEAVGSAFLDLLVAQERVQVLAQAVDEVARLAQTVALRRESGMASAYDVLRMELEAAAWRRRQSEAMAELTDRQVQLAILIGRPQRAPQGLAQGLPQGLPQGQLRAAPHAPLQAQGALTPWALDPTQATDLSQHPLIKTAQSDQALAQANLELARRERRPALSVVVGRGWGADRPGGVGSAGLTIEVPLLDTRIGLTHRAASELRSAILRGQATEAELGAELERQVLLVRERAAAYAQQTETVLPRLNTLRQMAEDAYRLGRGSLVDLLDASRVRHETRLDQLGQVASLMDAQWRLKVLRGDLSP